MSLRAQQCSLVVVIMLTVESALAWPPPMVMGRCLWVGWRGVAYTNVDTARRMRGSFSASDDRFVSSLVRQGGISYFLPRQFSELKDPPVPCLGALGRPPHRSAAHQRTSRSVNKLRAVEGHLQKGQLVGGGHTGQAWVYLRHYPGEAPENNGRDQCRFLPVAVCNPVGRSFRARVTRSPQCRSRVAVSNNHHTTEDRRWLLFRISGLSLNSRMSRRKSTTGHETA